MSKLRLRLSVSLDGFAAGPHQSIQDPLGVGGMRLHDWAFELRAFREMHGMDTEGTVDNASTPVIAGAFTNIGASIMGRNMFGGHPGPWRADAPWNGWWGTNPPFHHPVFVLTHHAREPLVLEGGTTFHFVTDGIDAALARAREAARGQDVSLGGGAEAARQYLNAGLVDEMTLSVVPVLLGAGERLLDGVRDLGALRLVRTIDAPGVAHMIFAR